MVFCFVFDLWRSGHRVWYCSPRSLRLLIHRWDRKEWPRKDIIPSSDAALPPCPPTKSSSGVPSRLPGERGCKCFWTTLCLWLSEFLYSHARQHSPLGCSKHFSEALFSVWSPTPAPTMRSSARALSLFEGTSLFLYFTLFVLRPQLSDGSRKVVNLPFTWLFELIGARVGMAPF